MNTRLSYKDRIPNALNYQNKAVHTGAVFSSVHENASLLCKVALTGLGLGVYDGMSLYITTSDYFCYFCFLLLLLIHNNSKTDLFTKLLLKQT